MLINYKLSCRTSKNQNGFSMIEVLITVLVLSFGLLGMAGLITTGMRGNTIAQYRTVATQQTLDMADRMRANLAGVRAGSYDTLAAGIPISDDCIGNAAECNIDQMAIYDHAQWNRANAALLPGGTGRVDGNLVNGFSITLMWVEKDMGGDTGLTCPGGTPADTRCFVTRISP